MKFERFENEMEVSCCVFSRGNEVAIRLNERDFKVLVELDRWGFLGAAQLDGAIFNRSAWDEAGAALLFNEPPLSFYTTYGYQRLLKLEKAGLICRAQAPGFPKVCLLTTRGHRLLSEAGHGPISSLKRSVGHSTLAHDLVVRGVGLALETTLGLRIRSERERNGGAVNGKRRDSVLLPDLWVVDSECPKAIEVELTQKSRSRYKEIWAAYARKLPRGAKLLYLSAWRSGHKTLARYAREFGHGFIYTAALSEFRNSPSKCRFIGRSAESYSCLEVGVWS